MDNKDNELFDGIMDVPNNVNENNNQTNLDYNFNFEMQEGPNTQMNTMNSNLQEAIDNNNLEVLNDVMLDENSTIDNSSNSEMEVLDLENTTKFEQLNEQGNPINHKLLKNLAQDTNNLINPDMINPLGKQKEQNQNVNVEEPKVNYDEIKTKKDYVFMTIIFMIIIVFIILLPNILSILGI